MSEGFVPIPPLEPGSFITDPVFRDTRQPDAFIQGLIDDARRRAVRRAPPDPTLASAIERQQTFTDKDVRGATRTAARAARRGEITTCQQFCDLLGLAALAVAVTDADQAQQVVAVANAEGIPCNRADLAACARARAFGTPTTLGTPVTRRPFVAGAPPGTGSGVPAQQQQQTGLERAVRVAQVIRALLCRFGVLPPDVCGIPQPPNIRISVGGPTFSTQTQPSARAPAPGGDSVAFINSSTLAGFTGEGGPGLGERLLRGLPDLLLGPGGPLPGGGNVTIGLPGFTQPVPGPVGTGVPSLGFAGGACPTNPFGAGRSTARAQTFVAVNPVTGRPTWFKPAGRPILWSRDLTTCKTVKRVARQARRASGGR